VKLLLDTQCWLWWFAQPERLNSEAMPLATISDGIAQIDDETNEIWLSVASVWEMGIKVAIGKLPLPEPLDSYISSRMMQLGAKSLPITATHAVQVSALPLHHRDPFDRMLIAQAQMEDALISTRNIN
jgi:PIN domain nuclease of toxin-antitoxin system